MDTDALFTAMWQAARDGGIPHLRDLKGFLDAEFRAIAQSVAAIAADRVAGKLTKKQAELAFQELEDSRRDLELAVSATLKAAAQDAVNAALGVAAGALNKALGLALL